MQLEGKVVVVTGAARGIGQEFARGLGAAGGRIVAAEIGDCTATVDELRVKGVAALPLRVDMRDMSSTRDMAEAAVRTFGRIDALINNAALYGPLRGRPV